MTSLSLIMRRQYKEDRMMTNIFELIYLLEVLQIDQFLMKFYFTVELKHVCKKCFWPKNPTAQIWICIGEVWINRECRGGSRESIQHASRCWCDWGRH